MRVLLSVMLTVALLFGVIAPGMAAEKGRSAGFLDVPEDDWSLPYILEMSAKGLMQGTGDGRFEPQAPLTRAQALTVAIRLMGLEAEAQALASRTITSAELPFADRGQIAPWAEPYVALAVARDILPLAEDGLLRPEEKATRLWVSVLLVRALGYDAEAQSKMATRLSFNDAGLIPASLVGYVATAVDHELVNGFPDRTFQPNQPVTRGQAAALLSRTDSQLGDLGKLRPGVLMGDLIRTGANKLTLLADGLEREVSLATGATIFLDGKKATLRELPVDSRLTLVINQVGLAEQVIAVAPKVDAGKNEVRGRITSLFLPQEMAGGLGLIVIAPASGEPRSFTMAPAISVSGLSRSLSDLRVGDEVKVKVAAGVAVAIELEKRAAQLPDGREDEIKGSIAGITPATRSNMAIIQVKTGSRTVGVNVAPGATIMSDGKKIDLSRLKVGDQVVVRTAGNLAIRITVEQPVKREEELEGRITAIRPHADITKAQFDLKTEKGSRTINLAAQVAISDGKSRLQFADLRVGDEVEVKLVGGLATKIEVEKRAPQEKAEEVKGTIQAVYTASISFNSSLEVKTDKGVRTIVIAPAATIAHGRNYLNLDDLRAGDRVTVKVVSGAATEILVTERAPQQQVEEVKGTIQAVYSASISFNSSFEVKTDKGVRVITIAPAASIKHGRTTLSLDDLREGDRVTVKVVAGAATEILVTERAPQDQAKRVTGLVEAIYPVSVSFQPMIELRTERESLTILLSNETVITRNGRRIELVDLKEGDRVSVKIQADVATEITVEAPAQTMELQATIVGISKRELTVRTKNGLEILTLDAGAVLQHKGRKIQVEDLLTGDKVRLWVRGDLILKLEVEQ